MLNWLRRPKHGSIERRDIPAGLWLKCARCGGTIYHRDLERSLKVCPGCSFHNRLTAEERLAVTLDKESFEEVEAGLTSGDPLGFDGYREKLAEARDRTGDTEAVIVGLGTIEGVPVAVAAMDFAFMGGSMGSVVGEKITRIAERALSAGLPLIIFASSGGARMQEGALSLMQLAKTSAAVARLHEARLPYISVMCDPTTGGVTASFAFQGDVLIAEPGAMIGFAGRRVIEQTIRRKLPADFQTAEFCLGHGLIDMVVARGEIRTTLSRLLRLLGKAETPGPPQPQSEAPEPKTRRELPERDRAGEARAMEAEAQLGELRREIEALSRRAGRGDEEARALRARAEERASHLARSLEATRPPWQAVAIARHHQRPKAQEFAGALLDGVVELHGDRLFRDDPAMFAGLGWFEGRPVAVLAPRKGRDTRENLAFNFGMPSPEGYRKALRVMRLAEKFGLPLVSIVDTPAAYPGDSAEERGQAEAISRNILEMTRLRTPVVVVITGEGGSGGALAIAVGDSVLMLEHAVYTVIPPEGCAAILWRDAARSREAAAALRLTAAELQGLGIADEVVGEPEGGAHADPQAAIAAVRDAVRRHLGALEGLPVEELLSRRYAKYRAMGYYEEQS